ncbi:MAG: hypothetical protein IJU45_05465 [Clostridia bacterium]|nr:hypothetical protein [Clostridia bacterium]
MKLFFKITSFILAFIVVFTPLSALAAEGLTTYNCPRIYVHGFMATPLIRDKTDKNSEEIFPPAVNDIISTVAKSVPALAAAYLKGGIKSFGEEAGNVANSIMSEAYLDKDGNLTDNSGVYFEYPDPSSINKNSKLDFTYDWRLDPVETAALLNDFVNYVLECSGAQKVSLSAHSLGGVIIFSYISIYGYEKVHGVCFNAAALFGESYTGDLMKGDMTFSGEAFDYYLRYLFDETEYQYLLSALTDIAAQIGVFDSVAYAANGLLDGIKETLFMQVMLPMFCCWPTIWAMVPDEDIDEAMDNVFNNMLEGQDYSALLSKIERFNRLVRDNKKETLIELNENATVYVLARYGYPSVPLTPSYNSLSDGTVDTKYASFGAVTSLYNETLSEEYLNNADPQYISPDKSVDASTCMFPEQTWFIRGFKHYSVPDSVTNFADMLLEQKEQATVDTFEQYPRFLVYDYENDLILPDDSCQKPDAISTLKNIIEDILKLFKLLIKTIIK